MRFVSLRLLFVGLSVALLVLLVPASALAASSKATTGASNSGQDITQAVTQSYNSDIALQIGLMVQLKDKDPGSVEPLSQKSEKRLLGVVVAANDSSVTIVPENSTKQQVYVATSGRYSVLVSNQNGPIKAGDYITISALDGVGMKADEDHTVILGKAVDAFNGTGNVIGKVSVKDTAGKSADISLGRITVTVDISHNPLASTKSDYVPGFLAKAAVAVASKPVSTARIYLGFVTLLVAAFVTANIVYSGVRSGMTAVGRNPLSKKSITKSLIQTIIAGLIVFIMGVFAVYLLLKL